ncbi:hypothetical protein GCM10020331_028070 [Ectobacillus funiculus]
MNTIIEGELPVLFDVIQQMHEVPFTKGIGRVATNIRIDDRRDKESSMEKKTAICAVKAVKGSLILVNHISNLAKNVLLHRISLHFKKV